MPVADLCPACSRGNAAGRGMVVGYALRGDFARLGHANHGPHDGTAGSRKGAFIAGIIAYMGRRGGVFHARRRSICSSGTCEFRPASGRNHRFPVEIVCAGEAWREAALEVSAQLPEGHIEVRLVGQDPALVYVGEEAAPPEPAADDGLTARITLRLPESLKASIEADAAREGISVNSLIVRALSRGTGGRVQRSGKRLRGYGQS